MFSQKITVVRGEEYVGVLQLAHGLELLHERGDHLVHGQHRLQAIPVTIVYFGNLFVVELRGVISEPGGLVGDVLLGEGRGAGCLLPGERALVAWRGCRGRVGGRRGNVRKEGLILRSRSANEVGSLPGEDVGKEGFGAATVRDDLAVLVDRVVVEVLFVYLAVPLVPAGRDVGWVARRVAVQVFAHEGGPVTRPLQAGGDRVLLQPLVSELLESAVWGLVTLYLVVVGVETGERGRPRGATQRLAGEGVLKGDALFHHDGTQLGHLLDGGVVQVVDQDEDYVGPIAGRCGLFFLRRLGWRDRRSIAARHEEQKDRQTCQSSEGYVSSYP